MEITLAQALVWLRDIGVMAALAMAIYGLLKFIQMLQHGDFVTRKQYDDMLAEKDKQLTKSEHYAEMFRRAALKGTNILEETVSAVASKKEP